MPRTRTQKQQDSIATAPEPEEVEATIETDPDAGGGGATNGSDDGSGTGDVVVDGGGETSSGVPDAGDIPPASTPRIGDVGWSDYVLSLFDPETELDEKGNVTTDGLRRVASLVLGPVAQSQPLGVSLVPIEGGLRASVHWAVSFRSKDGYVSTFGDVAGMTLDDSKYGMHAEASAATKAEGRALKKALQLRRVYTTEEMAGAGGMNGSNGSPGDVALIGLTQLRFIEKKCGELDINPGKFIKASRSGPFKHFMKVPYAVALEMIRTLDEWQKNTGAIPERVRGFDGEWQDSF